MKSWLSATGQSWKLGGYYALLGLSYLCLFLFAFDKLHLRLLPGPKGFQALALFLAFAAGAFAWIMVTVQCAQCRGRPGLHLFGRQEVRRWFFGIDRTAACPLCGYTPQGENF